MACINDRITSMITIQRITPPYIPRAEDLEDHHRNAAYEDLRIAEEIAEAGGYKPSDIRNYNAILTRLGLAKS